MGLCKLRAYYAFFMVISLGITGLVFGFLVPYTYAESKRYEDGTCSITGWKTAGFGYDWIAYYQYTPTRSACSEWVRVQMFTSEGGALDYLAKNYARWSTFPCYIDVNTRCTVDNLHLFGLAVALGCMCGVFALWSIACFASTFIRPVHPPSKAPLVYHSIAHSDTTFDIEDE